MSETPSDNGMESYGWLHNLLISIALVIGAFKNELTNATIPKNISLCWLILVYLDNREPIPHPIVNAGIKRPPVNPAEMEIITLMILPKTPYILNLSVVSNLPSFSNCFNLSS